MRWLSFCSQQGAIRICNHIAITIFQALFERALRSTNIAKQLEWTFGTGVFNKTSRCRVQQFHHHAYPSLFTTISKPEGETCVVTVLANHSAPHYQFIPLRSFHDPIVNDKTHRKQRKTRRKCAYPAARNINGSCSCIRAQAQRVLDTCCGSNSWIRRWVWMETISTQGPLLR